MKKLALTFFVLLGLTNVARAQQDSDIKFVMPVTAPCMETEKAEALLAREHGEQTAAQGAALIWNSRVQRYIPVLVRIFLNTSSLSFTIAYDVPGEGVTCVLAAGNEFQPSNRGTRL